MKWEDANARLDLKYYSVDWGNGPDGKYKYYCLSGPLYGLLNVGGKIFGKNWDYCSAVGIQLNKGVVSAKKVEFFH